MLDLLVFECDGVHYAVDAVNVESIVWLPALSPVDGAPVWCSGRLNWHGDSVTVIDLGGMLGHPPRARALSDQLIILTEGKRSLAILVTRVEQLLTADEHKVVVPALKEVEFVLPFKAELRMDDRLIMLLDCAALLDRLAAMDMTHADTRSLEIEPLEAQPKTSEDAQRFLERMHRLAEVRYERLAAGHQSYALVIIGEHRYAIPLMQVVEFAHLQHYTPLPGVPGFIVGCINLRGEILSIIDVDHFLQARKKIKADQVVVLSYGDKRLAILISCVERMIVADDDALQPIGESAEQHPLAHQLLRMPELIVAVLDVESLLSGTLLDVFEQV